MHSTAARVVIAFLVVVALISASLPVKAAPSDWIGVPPPDDCAAEPVDASYLIDAIKGDAGQIDIPLIGLEEDELPSGDAVAEDVLDAASATIWNATACVNAGDFPRFFSFMTHPAIYALVMGLFDAMGRPPGPFTEDEIANLEANLSAGFAADAQEMVPDEQGHIDRIHGARMLDDDHLLVLVDGRFVLDGTGYIVLTKVDGEWKIDRLGQLGDLDLAGLNSGDTSAASTSVAEATVASVTTTEAGADESTVVPNVTKSPTDESAGKTPNFPVPTAVDVIRRLAYHEISAWDVGFNTRGEEAPLLSDDGSTIVFTRASGSGDPEDPNRIFVMSSAGGPEREVDSYTPLCYCGSDIDIDAAGARVVSSDSVQLRVAETGGTSGTLLLTLASNEIDAVRISGDGSTIVFRVYRDTTFKDSGEAIAHGIYAINPDGSDLRMLAGADSIAPLFDVPVELVSSGGAAGLDVSFDGQIVVSPVLVDPQPGGFGQALIAITGKSGPVAMSDRVPFIANLAISGDGSTVAYVYTNETTNTNRVVVLPAPGGEPIELLDMSAPKPGIDPLGLNSAERIQLTFDGSALLLGGSGVLVDTASGTPIDLALPDTSSQPGDPAPLVSDRMEFATMDVSARHVVFVVQGANGIVQLARLDIEPDDLGGAPALSDLTLDAETVALNGVTTATVTVSVETDNTFLRVGMRVLRDGYGDWNVARAGLLLVDDGLSLGDTGAADGVYTANGIGADCCAALGPRTMRIKAETVDSAGFRHASTIDGAAFAVVE